MTRALLIGTSGRPRRWARRFATIASILLFDYALYRAAFVDQQVCHHHACDVGSLETHILFWLIVAALAIAALVAARMLLADDQSGQ
jgi:hypothetical protein